MRNFSLVVRSMWLLEKSEKSLFFVVVFRNKIRTVATFLESSNNTSL